MTITVNLPTGRVWELNDVARKLSLRAALPGARVFDLSADALRIAKAKGVPDSARLPLALPGSWLVNSPAQSIVFRRWALMPQRALFLELVALFDPPRLGAPDDSTCARLASLVEDLGKEPTVVEAVSKAAALLVPHALPLMPPLAVAFVLGPDAALDATSFVAMARWFGDAVEANWDALTECAAQHREVTLDAAQVLDRLLWFDSDGYKHFPSPRPG